MYIIFKVCLEYPQNIEEIKRSNDKKNTAQWKFSGDKHKSAHPINLGDSQDLPGRQYTSALPM